MSSHSIQLDHVILLVPYNYLLNSPDWINQNFTLSPGGRHADNKTENRLIIFADGTYLELIAFINDDPAKRAGHWWDKPYGVVDYALTTPDSEFAELPNIKERLSRTQTGITYTSPIPGGRKTPSGLELKWRVTFPTTSDDNDERVEEVVVQRGQVPFFCNDVTPRTNRVSISEDGSNSNIKHPSGATGMAGVRVQTRQKERLTAATAAILNKDLSNDGRFGIHVPRQVEGVAKPAEILIQEGDVDLTLSLVLQTPRTDVPDIFHKIGDGAIHVVFETL